ncbi:MAG: hypothetical protein ACK526_07865, partial [Planctomyces sp.]
MSAVTGEKDISSGRKTSGGSPYAECDEFIQWQIKTARERIHWTDLLTAAVMAGLLLVSYIFVFTILDHWVIRGGFSPWTRAALLGVVLLTCGGILIQFLVRPWLKRINPLYAARMLDRSDTEHNGVVTSLLDVQTSGRQLPESVIRTLEKQAALRLSHIHVDEAIDRRTLTKLGTALFLLVVITCIYAVLSPKSISLLRPLSLAKQQVSTQTVIRSVRPGHATVAAGETLEITVDLTGKTPSEVFVVYTTDDNRFVDEKIVMRTDGNNIRFQATMNGESGRGIRQSLQYRVIAGDAVSEDFRVTVEAPPTAQVTTIRYQHLPYMGIPERIQEAGSIDTWEGTHLTLSAQSNAPLKSAVLRFSDDAAFSSRAEELRMRVNGTELDVEFDLTAREDGTFPGWYRIEVTDQNGRTDPEPAVYTINVKKDQAPSIRLLDPTRDMTVPSNAVVPLLIEAEDPDFLVRSVRLHYEVNGNAAPREEVIFDELEGGPQKRILKTWDFRLQPMSLKPGDRLRFYLSARDNKPPLGNRSRTPDLELQIQKPASQQAVEEQLQQDRRVQEAQRRDRDQSSSGSPDSPRSQDNQKQSPSDSQQGSQRGDDATQPPAPASGGQESIQTNPQQKKPEADPSRTSSDQQQNAEQQSGGSEGDQTDPNAPSNDNTQSQESKDPKDGTDDRQNAASEAEKNDGSGSGDTGNDARAAGTEREAADSRSGNSSDHPEDSAAESSQNGSQTPDKPASDQDALQRLIDKLQNDSSENNSDQANENQSSSEDETSDRKNEEAGEISGNSDHSVPNPDPSEPNTDGEKPSDGEKSGGEKSGGEKSGGEKSGGEKSGGEKSGGEKSGGEKSGGEESGGEKSGGEKSGGEKSGGEKSGGEKSGGEKSGGEKSGGEKSVGEKSGGEKSGGEKSGGEKSGGEKSGG